MFFSAASSLGRSTDGVFVVLAVVSAVVLVLVTLVFLFLVVRYGRRRHPLASDSAGSAFWEVACTLGAAALVLFFFYLGLGGFAALTTSPADAMVVRVTARMWSWSFEYPGGLKSRRLVLAAGAPVRLVLSSPDVIHSLYVPAFRVKRDVVPGRDASVSFTPDRVGGYDLFCAEFCGLGHSRMVARVEVLSAGDFSAWYGGAEPDEAAAEKPAPADEKKAAERKAAEKLAAEKRAAEQKAAEQKAAEKKAAEKRAAEKRAAEKRAAEKRAAEKKAAERKAAEEREAEEKKEAEKPAPPAEKKVVEKKPAPVPPVEKKAVAKKEPVAEKAAPAAEKKAVEEKPAPVPAPPVERKAVAKEEVRAEKPAVAPAKPSAPPAGSAEPRGPLPDGAALYRSKGCSACHSADGSGKAGPTFKGLYWKDETVITGGVERVVTADEVYLRRAILDPGADVVKGFEPTMPSGEGVLTDREIDAIIEYIKTLR